MPFCRRTAELLVRHSRYATAYAEAVHKKVRQMERSPSTLDLLWAGLRGAVRRRPAVRTGGAAHAPGGPSSSMCALQATLALARKVRIALLFLESNSAWNCIDQKNPTATGTPPQERHTGTGPSAHCTQLRRLRLALRAHGVRTRGSTRLCVRERAAVAVSLAGPSGSIRRLARGCACVCVCLRAAVGAACDADARATSRVTAAGGLGLQRHAAHSLRCGSDTVAVGAARDDRRGDGFRAQLRASSETARRHIFHALIDRLLTRVA